MANAAPSGRQTSKKRDQKALKGLSGDPLRLLPQHRRVAVEEQRERAKKIKAGKAQPHPFEDVKSDRIVDPTMGIQKVKRRGFAMKGYQDHQMHAADMFAKDWQLAFADTMKAAPWQHRVDGGSPDHGAHHRRIDAQSRMAKLSALIGERGFVLVETIIVHGIGPEAIHKAGGPQRASTTHEFKTMLDQIATFYNRPPPKRDRLLAAIDKIILLANRGEPTSAAIGAILQ